MAAAEIPFELFGLALEATKGTAVTPPTHTIPAAGTITPFRTKYRPEESRGTLEEIYRSKTVRTGCNWEMPDSLADPNYAPILWNLLMKAVTSPTTPTNGVLTRLWSFVPTLTSDDIKAATLYFGDPNVQIFQSTYCMADEMTISADATGEKGVTWGMKGMGSFPTRVSAPTYPATIPGDLLMPGAMQLWIDTSSAIGTTEITGRFIKSDWKIPTGVAYKNYANGPTGTRALNFTKHGRKKRHAEATIEVELNDLSIGAGKEYLSWEADTIVKMRIRFNGGLIESVTPDYYSYLQLDIYGALDAFDWGSVEDTNRTMKFTVQSEYNSTLGASFALYAQSTRTAL
jgi:hypothetical protein